MNSTSDRASNFIFHYRYPWGDEAFKKAKQENKPIFLSGELVECSYLSDCVLFLWRNYITLQSSTFIHAAAFNYIFIHKTGCLPFPKWENKVVPPSMIPGVSIISSEVGGRPYESRWL